jgi:elongator complex protein 3
MVPEYCRVIRMLRDFPSELILSGTKTLNLRQIIEQNPAHRSRDIRTREIKDSSYNPTDLKIIERSYTAGFHYQKPSKKNLDSVGEEIFISLEDTTQDKLVGLVRLRLPKSHLQDFPELENAAIIRELHVYGQQKTLKQKQSLNSKTQHRGFGKQLMEHAENLARQKGYPRIAVISAIGTREYYRKLGYHLDGTYMLKDL